jgi:hypothetical protein
LPPQALPEPFVFDLDTSLAQTLKDATATVAAPVFFMQLGNLCIQARVGLGSPARRTRAPLAISRARHAHLPAHPAHAVLVAMCFDPAILHRDSLAKYAALFTISESTFALASSRRKRAFSASSSDIDCWLCRTDGVALPAVLLCRRTQFPTLDCDVPRRLAG